MAAGGRVEGGRTAGAPSPPQPPFGRVGVGVVRGGQVPLGVVRGGQVPLVVQAEVARTRLARVAAGGRVEGGRTAGAPSPPQPPFGRVGVGVVRGGQVPLVVVRAEVVRVAARRGSARALPPR